MRYYATASGSAVYEAMDCGLLGQIVRPGAGNKLRVGVDAVADNGLFGKGFPGNRGYLKWLSKRTAVRWAVAPDVVADHHATLERSWPMLRPIRDLVGGVALCAQNGAQVDDLPWGYFDCVFLAGIPECVECGWIPALDALGPDLVACHACLGPMREWKEGPVAAAITAEANRRGVWVHMGRVNTLRRLTHAHSIGCDSADGTTMKYGADRNLPQMLRWLDDLNRRCGAQVDLFPGLVPAGGDLR